MFSVTKSGRLTKKPERFAELSFIPGSGIEGCDQYDRNYDDGSIQYFGREECKDGLDETRDEIYEKDLKNHMLVKESCNALPSDMSKIITKMAFSKSNYSDDINFIASDLITPEKQISRDDNEDEYDWNTEDETSDEEEWCESDDEE